MNITKIIGSIKAKLFDGTGTALTSTLVSGKQSLDVNVTQAVTAKVQDGAGNALTSAARGSTRPLDVQVRDASGNQVTTFGADPVGIKNASSTTINPATEETLSAVLGILYQLGFFSNNGLVVHLADSATDAGYVAVNTVTTVTTLTNIGTTNGDDLYKQIYQNAWWNSYSL